MGVHFKNKKFLVEALFAKGVRIAEIMSGAESERPIVQQVRGVLGQTVHELNMLRHWVTSLTIRNGGVPLQMGAARLKERLTWTPPVLRSYTNEGHVLVAGRPIRHMMPVVEGLAEDQKWRLEPDCELPEGLAFSQETGWLVGTPVARTEQMVTLRVSAANLAGRSAVYNIGIKVDDPAPPAPAYVGRMSSIVLSVRAFRAANPLVTLVVVDAEQMPTAWECRNCWRSLRWCGFATARRSTPWST